MMKNRKFFVLLAAMTVLALMLTGCMGAKMCIRDRPNAPVTLRVYDGRDGVGEYYSDAGDGYGYEAGESYRADLRWNHFTGCLDISEAGDERFKPERFILERV